MPDSLTTDSGETVAAAPANEDPLLVPPRVAAVYVSGSAWNSDFKTYVQSQGLGDATYGFAPSSDTNDILTNIEV